MSGCDRTQGDAGRSMEESLAHIECMAESMNCWWWNSMAV